MKPGPLRILIVVPFAFLLQLPTAQAVPFVLPSLLPNLVDNYDWEHPVAGNAAREADQGFSGTDINLVNGGAAMRVNDAAYRLSTHAIQTMQVGTTFPASTDDWKAGIYGGPPGGVASLSAFNAVKEVTLMGWVKPTGTNPNLNTNTANATDLYNAIGLFGILQGGNATQNNGHNVRALLEIIDVSGTMRLVALGRRIDSGSSRTFAASDDWHTLIPQDEWTHLAATFNFDTGDMALYVNGVAVAGSYTAGGNLWNLTAGTDVTSATNPGGIKIGGSFPQDTNEQNPFNGRFDDIMTFNRALSASEIAAQYQLMAEAPEPSSISLAILGLVSLAGFVRRRRVAPHGAR